MIVLLYWSVLLDCVQGASQAAQERARDLERKFKEMEVLIMSSCSLKIVTMSCVPRGGVSLQSGGTHRWK